MLRGAGGRVQAGASALDGALLTWHPLRRPCRPDPAPSRRPPATAARRVPARPAPCPGRPLPVSHPPVIVSSMMLTSEAAQVVEAAGTFLAAVMEFEPASAPGADCVAVAAACARVEKGASGLLVLAGAHAVEAGAHRADGVSDPVSWVARQGGTTGAEARQSLELARSLAAHPETKTALLCGSVSLAQAKEIARAAQDSPGEEHELLEVARHGDLTKLRDETRERRLSRTKPEELHMAQLAARRFRHWRDGLGMVCFDGALPPETGIPLVTRIEREAARLRRAAMRDGAAERFWPTPPTRSCWCLTAAALRRARPTSSSSATCSPGGAATPTQASPAT